MRKQMIQDAAFEVATQVRLVEDSIEQALSEIAELQGRMIRARAAARVATSTGHEALEHVATALQGLVTARGDVATAHAVLKQTRGQIPGLRTVSFGEGDPCPPETGITDLRIVA